MPIDIVCSGCQQTLRVPHQVAGKQIKCSICEAIITVPAFSAGTSPAKSASIEKKWYVKDENGQRYGPVPKSELDGWLQEGRVTSGSQLLEEGSNQWQWATDIYPSLAGGAVPAPVRFVGSAPADNNPFAGIGKQAPSRGGGGGGGPFDFGGGGQSMSSRARGRHRGNSRASGRGKVGPKSKIVAGILGIIFGALGIHRFYLGYVGMGIIQIVVTFCTLGIGGWWGIIEGIMILTGSFDRDAKGQLLRD